MDKELIKKIIGVINGKSLDEIIKSLAFILGIVSRVGVKEGMEEAYTEGIRQLILATMRDKDVDKFIHVFGIPAQ